MTPEILRELGAQWRTFRTPAGVLVWYAAARARRGAHGIDPDAVGAASSDAQRRVAQATYARIVACLVPRHQADEHDEPLAFAAEGGAARAEAERRVELLLEWYLGRRTRLTDSMIEVYGFGGERACVSYLRFGERVLRRRFRAAGLLREGEDAT